MKKLLFLVMTFACFASVSFAADVLSLKNGSVLKGELIEISQDKVRFKTGDGSLWVYDVAEVQSVTKEDKEEERNTKANSSYPFKKKGFVCKTGQVLEVGEFCTYGFDFGVGYQFNPNIQLGIGTGVRRVYEILSADGWGFPFYADFNASFLRKKVSPFFALRAGAISETENGNTSVYVAPSSGVRINFAESRALFVSLGFSFAEGGYYYDDYYECEENLTSFAIRVDFQF